MSGYRYAGSAKHPVTVAQLADATTLRGLATALDLNIDDLTTQDARQAAMTSIQILNGAASRLTP